MKNTIVGNLVNIIIIKYPGKVSEFFAQKNLRFIPWNSIDEVDTCRDIMSANFVRRSDFPQGVGFDIEFIMKASRRIEIANICVIEFGCFE